MKTIIINTSKKATDTKLDILFKAPYDQNTLLWFNVAPEKLDTVPQLTNQALITEADVVERDYNLVLLINLSELRFGNDQCYVELYKTLLLQYVGKLLLEPLKDLDLLPVNTAVYFADSSENLGTEEFYGIKDPKPQEAPLKKTKAKKSSGRLTEMTEDEPLPPSEKKSFNVEERRILTLFDWKEEEDFHPDWKIKLYSDKEEYLDFHPLFLYQTSDIEHSRLAFPLTEYVKVCMDAVKDAKDHFETDASATQGTKDQEGRCSFSFLPKAVGVYFVLCHFSDKNSQSAVEGFFNLFANAFTCIQKQSFSSGSKRTYTSNEIVSLLKNAYLRYVYYSTEANVPFGEEYEPIETIFRHREKIYTKRLPDSSKKKTFSASSGTKPSDPSESPSLPEDYRLLRGVDKEFADVIRDVFNNYDENTLRKENQDRKTECLRCLWSWRDEHHSEEITRSIDTMLLSAEGPLKADMDEERKRSGSNVLISLRLLEEEHQEEFTQLLNEITDMEHRLLGFKNVFPEIRSLMLKYSDLMRKSKKSLLCIIGAAVSVGIAMLPYLISQSTPLSNPIVNNVLFTLFTLGFVFLYSFGAGLYLNAVKKDKCALLMQAQKLKKQSEEDRKQSLEALEIYYKTTVIRAENHTALWREILRRNRKNAHTGIKRNNHIRRFKLLAETVVAVATMLKIDVRHLANASRDNTKHPPLNVCESYFSRNNYPLYSILESVPEDKKEKEEA